MAIIHIGTYLEPFRTFEEKPLLMWCFSISVLVKFKPTTSETIKRELCDQVCALKDVIPGITKATAGKNFSERAKGYEWGKYIYYRYYLCLVACCINVLHRLGIRTREPEGNYRWIGRESACWTLTNQFVSRIWRSMPNTLLISNSLAI
jgi:hypothetical protein